MEREVLRAALAPGADCLSMEALGRYADGALGAHEHAAAAAHIRGCLNCQAELALMEAVTSTPVRAFERDAGTSATREWLRPGLFPVAAAAAVFLFVAGVLYTRVARAPELPHGVTTEGEVTRSLSVTVRGPVGDVVEVPRRFEWVAVERAVRYRVRILEVDRREVWSESTSALEVDLPSSARAFFTPGRTLLWEVTAYDASGAVLAESGQQPLRLVLR
jgi:hypothetical protein